ncbi:DUF2892 domain-containing protein [bacterium]|nr:DUF2892 domain-containing protein [bacterium]
MKENLSILQVYIRLILGMILTTLLFMGGPYWTVIGLYFLFSGSLRFCFFKKLITG